MGLVGALVEECELLDDTARLEDFSGAEGENDTKPDEDL